MPCCSHESPEASGVTVGQADLLQVALEPLDKRNQGGLLSIGGEVGIGSGTHCSGGVCPRKLDSDEALLRAGGAAVLNVPPEPLKAVKGPLRRERSVYRLYIYSPPLKPKDTTRSAHRHSTHRYSAITSTAVE